MIKFLTSTFPLFIFHLFCCGALLGVLIATGFLFALSEEGSNKTLFLPALGLAALFFFLYRRHNTACGTMGGKSTSDHVISFLLYTVFSLLLGIIFIVYFFIPWWIPNYRGGILLP